jgi:GNAT superfamily N-acetyltransferase
MTLADLQVADGLNQAAFETQESRIADMRRYLEAQPDGWFLAESHLGPVGMVGALNYHHSAYIGQLAVLPEFQKMGIGSALMQHVLVWLQGIKIPSALLDASKQGYPLYTARFHSSRYYQFICLEPTSQYSGRQQQVLYPSAGGAA